MKQEICPILFYPLSHNTYCFLGSFFCSKLDLRQGISLLKACGVPPCFIFILLSILFLLLSFWKSSLWTQVQFLIVNKFRLG